MYETVVVYSSKHGICEQAAKQLAHNLGCPYQNVSNIRSINEFTTVILGTSIYAGKPNKAMQSFINAHLGELLNKNIAFFIVCSYVEPHLILGQIQASYPHELLDKAFYSGCIASGINMDKLSFLEKKIFTKVSGIKNSYFNFNCEEMEKLKSSYKQID